MGDQRRAHDSVEITAGSALAFVVAASALLLTLAFLAGAGHAPSSRP